MTSDNKYGAPDKFRNLAGKGGAAERMSFRADRFFKARKRLSAARDDAVQVL